ncbi:MAG: hypothetical protein IPJ07_19220 [Acidobacteria bacterium]|nr:hypothetical protein [Acidobacteriota bacterium]
MDLQEQARQALKNLQIAVQSAGGELSDVISLRIYVVGDQSSHTASLERCLESFFQVKTFSTSTWLGVASWP